MNIFSDANGSLKKPIKNQLTQEVFPYIIFFRNWIDGRAAPESYGHNVERDGNPWLDDYLKFARIFDFIAAFPAQMQPKRRENGGRPKKQGSDLSA